MLSFHYGFTPDQIASMPNWLVRVYLDELPALLAKQQMAAVEATSYAHMEKQARDKMSNHLARLAQGGHSQPAAPPLKSHDEAAQVLAAVGIGLQPPNDEEVTSSA